jgi:hypothetical protein
MRNYIVMFLFFIFVACSQKQESEILEKRSSFVSNQLLVKLDNVDIAPTVRQEKDQLDVLREEHAEFFRALAQVESGDRDNVVGDRGKAFGRFQVWFVYWQDAVSKWPDLKEEGGHETCLRDGNYSERVVAAYFLRYGRKFLAAKDYESLARIHNGGPKGHLRSSTEGYWKKVKKILDK